MIQYEELHPSSHPTAVALGCFDGLHKGHAAVIGRAVQEQENGLTPTVFTFPDSPLRELSGSGAPRLMENSERSRLLEGMGVQYLYQIPFSSLMNLSPEEFVSRILRDVLQARKVFCGFNYHFGKGGRAGSGELQQLCKQEGIEAVSLDPVMEEGAPISSTRIRNMVETGNIESANRMLGRPFFYTGEVINGRKLGRLMGTPTLNQVFPEGFILPRFGVYAALVSCDGWMTSGVTNIGMKPTVGSPVPLSETWMPDYQGKELYGKQVKIQLLHFLRPEKKFEDLDRLRQAILSDGDRAREICRHYVEKNSKK